MAHSLRPQYLRAPASADSIGSIAQATISDRDSASLSLSQEKAEYTQDPFATPMESQLPSRMGSALDLRKPKQPNEYFRSRRVKKGNVEKPWMDHKDPKEKWVTIIPLIGMLVGLAISAFFVWDGLQTVVNHSYCPVLDDSFANGLDPAIWTREAEVGGFGNGQFEQTTSTEENVFVQDGMLHIKPTLEDAKHIETDYIIDLRNGSVCTSPVWSNCLTSTNTTNGTIVPPVKSGRLNAKSKPIKYGRIEATVRLPQGDWLWPAIWMLPVNRKYGEWPSSGEIDILESRGNNHTYRQGGNDIMSSALHWGPNPANDAWWRTNNKRNALHTTFSKNFHTFGLEWSEKYIFTYIDSRLLQVMYVNFDPDTHLWDRGKFPKTDAVNGTLLLDPWSGPNTVPSTPFDQDFYLILNVAVGGTNGWFEDGKSGKPWVDSSKRAKKDFWDAREQWLPTWGENGKDAEMLVKSVKIWQQKGYNNC
ncbi:Beta-1,3-glucan-binding protein [Cyphellophora attinorum]|uniref:Beta-1,3-glucan-binding protein n=1 Tax=Cyphellophora attinorum TaxID=1664694 RepID=A0A0N1H3T1_9EURO|nr:Beta-1,3-glucan-binding protein [Phialophora attinorum]KPI39642.1 Beta-1,3-glucan-binding protein [Phialophora attinorum]